jgi:hypothetical protein
MYYQGTLEKNCCILEVNLTLSVMGIRRKFKSLRIIEVYVISRVVLLRFYCNKIIIISSYSIQSCILVLVIIISYQIRIRTNNIHDHNNVLKSEEF